MEPISSALIPVEHAIAPLTAPEARSRNPVLCYLHSLPSQVSRRVMTTCARRLAEIWSLGRCGHELFPWSMLQPQDVARLRTVLAQIYKPLTANWMLAGLRGILRWCWRLEYWDHERLERTLDVKPVTGKGLPAGRGLASEEVRDLFGSCATDGPRGARDAAILALLYSGGLRRFEVCALVLEDLDPRTGKVDVQKGKGAKARTTYLAEGGRRALRAWLSIRGDAPGPLVCKVSRYGTPVLKPMQPGSVWQILDKRAKAAGVLHLSPHDLRRTMIGDLLDSGAEIVSVSRLCGHSSLTQTARYDRRPERAAQEAAEKLDVPFREQPPPEPPAAPP